MTNDKQYNDAYNSSKECVDKILGQDEVCLPQFFCLKDIPDQKLNIIAFWNKIICTFIKDKNASDYVGHTVKPSKRSIAEGHIWFDMEVKNRKLYGSDGLVFIPQNLSDYQNLVNSNKYYNNDDGLCSDLPYTVPDDTKFSIKLDIEDIEILQRIQKNRYYVFYDGKHDNTPSLNFEL